MNYLQIIEAFTIFSKYSLRHQEIAAEHNELFAGPESEIVSVEDRQRLEELGWYPDKFETGFRATV